MYLADAPEGRATIAEVAAFYAISEAHMVKVVHFLGREGLLRNTRGRGGGIELARAPQAINVGRVVRLTEGGDLPAECFDRKHNTCRLAGRCRLERALGSALGKFYETLEGYTLEDLRRVAA